MNYAQCIAFPFDTVRLSLVIQYILIVYGRFGYFVAHDEAYLLVRGQMFLTILLRRCVADGYSMFLVSHTKFSTTYLSVMQAKKKKKKKKKKVTNHAKGTKLGQRKQERLQSKSTILSFSNSLVTCSDGRLA